MHEQTRGVWVRLKLSTYEELMEIKEDIGMPISSQIRRITEDGIKVWHETILPNTNAETNLPKNKDGIVTEKNVTT